ncbi:MULTISPECIES: glycosyltransferase family 4 protein [Bacillus]|uniref:glycosyltransferase family 4 protein n=1 Tax=Bacillus TaxID=1386 RepID=UPI0009C1A1FF|nr:MULTISPECIES: glycosyltransferase family 4 protein [Bacillus cereus group]KAB2396148.1 glycosyltransferase family 4 protein [Bacillus cereus]MEB4817305.1 glycosyltransferase family 4 protein [Bacillus thuringiensis]HDR3895452.1 glycosyltransferase family 4 protein [Bacillus cereus]
MKVLHIAEYVKGGIATYLQEVIEYQEQCENIDDVFLLYGDVHSGELKNINSENIYGYSYKRSPKYIIKAIKEINAYINLIKPDIIHVHSSFAGLYVRLLYFIKRKNAKIVYCSHGWSFLMDTSQLKKRVYSLIERVLALKTDTIVNISLDEYTNSLKYHLPKNKSTIIYNGISDRSNDKRVSLEIEKDCINLLFVGRFDKQKGLDILIDIFKNNNLPKIKLYIIGEPVVSQAEFKFPQNVINLGWIDNKLLDSYYSDMDAVIMPSRWEGFGLVAIEAMKNRKPVIVSNRGALPELINQEVNGYIFDLEKPNDLVDILLNLDKIELKEMGKRGRNIYEEKFTSNIMNRKIIEEYQKLVDGLTH